MKIRKLSLVLAFLLMCANMTWADGLETNSQEKILEENRQRDGAISHMPDAVWATPEEAVVQLEELKQFVEQEEMRLKNAKASIQYEYDVEDDPIHIGNWNPGECGPNTSAFYVRHTLGSYNQSTKYLTSYGETSWYNVGKNALPYRNGSSSFPEHRVTDVKMGIYFSIRDLETDAAVDVYRDDVGPNHCPGSEYVTRLADLDKPVFKSLHGNTSDGTFDCRTYVPINNYNPS